MDFTPGEAEAEVSRLAAQVLAGRDAAVAGAAPDFDMAAWKDLAQAGLLALALPAGLGGDELGVQATAAVLTQAGRYAARVPALATLALGVLPVMRSADGDLRARLLTGVASGDTLLTAAIRERSDAMPSAPLTMLTMTGSGQPATVTGRKIGVPYAAAARWILVPCSVRPAGARPGGTAVAVIEPDAASAPAARPDCRSTPCGSTRHPCWRCSTAATPPTSAGSRSRAPAQSPTALWRRHLSSPLSTCGTGSSSAGRWRPSRQ
jgi:alkylation response protein AidB-like acyl-CoA dehydrogenase